jgi:hypothetical protein
MPEPRVAARAQHPADNPGDVAVVNHENLTEIMFMFATNQAAIPLRPTHLVDV